VFPRRIFNRPSKVGLRLSENVHTPAGFSQTGVWKEISCDPLSAAAKNLDNLRDHAFGESFDRGVFFCIPGTSESIR
jgi:hypothetical protein